MRKKAIAKYNKVINRGTFIAGNRIGKNIILWKRILWKLENWKLENGE